MHKGAIATPTRPVTVHAGFIPLLDCAPLVVAKELGLDLNFGISLQLHREVSWANIRDNIDMGILDCAQMLAPMPLAATLGLGRRVQPVIAPMGLSLNGNAITASNALYDEMLALNPEATLSGGMRSAAALADVVQQRQIQGRELLTLGKVYPFSAHNYDLRCWLASAGINPDNDVNLVVVPPPLLSNSLRAGKVDGFCVGSPWNSVSVSAGDGVILALKDDLWASSLEKVLGVREQWAADNKDTLLALIATLYSACRWLDQIENMRTAAQILARPQFVGVDENLLFALLVGDIDLGRGRYRKHEDLVIFNRNGANIPDPADAVWFLTQMVRWGQAREPFAIGDVAKRVFRRDLFDDALTTWNISAASQRVSPRPLYCGERFDPSAPIDYLLHLDVSAGVLDVQGFQRANPG